MKQPPAGYCEKCKIVVLVDLPNRCPDKDCPPLVAVPAKEAEKWR